MKSYNLGQLFFLRLRENRWSTSLERLLRRSSPGGVLLGAPLPRSAESTREFLLKIARALPHLPFLAVREEGGTHDPLSQLFPPLPSPRAAAERGLSAVARLGELIGEALGLLGFNTNFAPLLDLSTPITVQTLGARTFGSDPHHVAEGGEAFLRGLRRHKVLACGKHFPGWGSVPIEDSPGLLVSGKPMAGLWREDLVPFRKLLPQLPMILISNAAYKAYDFDHARPASLSAQVVMGLLRVKLGYRGLALAYDLESAKVRGALHFGDAVIEAVTSGCDMVVVDQGGSSVTARQALEGGLASGRLSPRRVREALERIRAARKRLSPPSGKVRKSALDRLVRRYETFAMEFQDEELENA